MIYFIFLASLALVTCYLVFHWRNRMGFRLRKQLVDSSTRPLVDLSTYFVFYFPCLQATGSLVYSLTCPLTMLLCLLFTLSTSNLLTCLLVHLSTYHVTLSLFASNWLTCPLVDLSTCLLFNKKTTLPCIFNKFCYICKLFNTYVSHVC